MGVTFRTPETMPVRHSSPPPPGGRILLVDDNANGLSARKCVLEELGYRIITASNAADAIEEFGKHKFDLVVTDFKMPRMNGVELIARLREESPGVPIILLSGYVDALGMNEKDSGADVVIQKSANEVSHLVRSVARLMRKKPGSEKGPRARRKSGS